MIYAGQHVFSCLRCSECGTDLGNATSPESAFYSVSCSNGDCSFSGVRYVIEKKTMEVIFVEKIWYDFKNKRQLYPVLVDKDGNQVWPEKK